METCQLYFCPKTVVISKERNVITFNQRPKSPFLSQSRNNLYKKVLAFNPVHYPNFCSKVKMQTEGPPL